MNVERALEACTSNQEEKLLANLRDLGTPHTTVSKLFFEIGGVTVSEKNVRAWRKKNTTYQPNKKVTETVAEPEYDENDVVDLKKKLAAALKKAEVNKLMKMDYIDAIYKGCSDAILQLEFNPVPVPVPNSGGSEEVAVAVLGDWQLGKKTPDYDSTVCENRIEKYGDKVVELTNIQRKDHPVNKVVVIALGDMVEGELIFPGQHYLLDSSIYQQTVVDGPRILVNFMRKMLANFTEVEFYGVIGNHGQIGGRSYAYMNKESNLDRMLYTITKQILGKEDRIKWEIPDSSTGIDGPNEANWYTIVKVGNYSTMLLHGDQFASLTVTAIQRKIAGWALALDHFDDVDFGHWHTPTMLTFNRITARGNGSPESQNTFAIEKLAAIGYPSQSLRFVHPDRGIVTASYCVWLEK